MKTLQYPTIPASESPERDILKITYEGQDPARRKYRAGYEHFLTKMPVLRSNDEDLEAKVTFTKSIMKKLTAALMNRWVVVATFEVPQGNFARTIIAMEPPIVGASITEGTELVVAHWGDGHTSPVHGHADGYIHEELLIGKMRVNSYRIVDPVRRIARPLKTEIFSHGTIASEYHHPNPLPRTHLVHNFTAIGSSATLHYLPEHTRDGRDNMFSVEHFDEEMPLNHTDVTRISALDGMYLQPGDVVLVRSQNVPDYGDHYIIVTGPPVMKEHGMRVQDVAIHTLSNTLLDKYPAQMGLTLLKLKPEAARTFLKFHGVEVKNHSVIFPAL